MTKRIYFQGFIEVSDENIDSAQGEVEQAACANGGNVSFSEDEPTGSE